MKALRVFGIFVFLSAFIGGCFLAFSAKYSGETEKALAVNEVSPELKRLISPMLDSKSSRALYFYGSKAFINIPFK